MTNTVIDRGANGLRKPIVVQRGRFGVMRQSVIIDNLIQLIGGDPRLDKLGTCCKVWAANWQTFSIDLMSLAVFTVMSCNLT
jgi:hypothetical protein